MPKTCGGGPVDTLLARLSDAFGPSGSEEAVRAVLIEELSSFWDGARTDAMGNLIASQGLDRPGPRGLIAAHMDEVGLLVDEVDDKGFLRFKALGGIDPRILPSKRVVCGESRALGVIGATPSHLLDKDDERAPKIEDLYIDIGATSRDEALDLVDVGEAATFETKFAAIGDGLVKGKALDDRAGCYIAARVLQGHVPLPMHYAFTVQEEVGLRGARVAANRVRPDFAVVLEATTCADRPDPGSPGHSTYMGAGPVLTFQDSSTVPTRRLLDFLADTAEREGIAYQWKETTLGGNDAGSIHKASGGIATVSVSLPCRYIHSPCSFLYRSDIEQAIELVRAFLTRISREGLPS